LGKRRCDDGMNENFVLPEIIHIKMKMMIMRSKPQNWVTYLVSRQIKALGLGCMGMV
jgi:hypothetical protein